MIDLLILIAIPTAVIGAFGIVTYAQGLNERNKNIKADGGHGNPLYSFWTWCYWKGVGMTEEEGEQEWQDYLRGPRS